MFVQAVLISRLSTKAGWLRPQEIFPFLCTGADGAVVKKFGALRGHSFTNRPVCATRSHPALERRGIYGACSTVVWSGCFAYSLLDV